MRERFSEAAGRRVVFVALQHLRVKLGDVGQAFLRGADLAKNDLAVIGAVAEIHPVISLPGLDAIIDAGTGLFGINTGDEQVRGSLVRSVSQRDGTPIEAKGYIQPVDQGEGLVLADVLFREQLATEVGL